MSDPLYDEGIITEENLYYELGYRFANWDLAYKGELVKIELWQYLFLLSAFLHFALGIQQTFTMIACGILYIQRSYLNRSKNRLVSKRALTTLFAINLYDHFAGNVEVIPGVLFDRLLNPLAWLIEALWVIIFTAQVIVSTQPVTKSFSNNVTIRPETNIARKNFNIMRRRLELSEYPIQEREELVDQELMKNEFQRLLSYVFTILGIFLLFDFGLWRVIGAFGGGNNELEEYYFSGLALLLIISFFIFSGTIFTESPQNETQPTTPTEF